MKNEINNKHAARYFWNDYSKIFTIFLCFLNIYIVYGQKSIQTNIDKSNDNELLDSFIESKAYGSIIQFDASNIKTFWVDNTVLSSDSKIKILLENGKSVPLKLQLANVNETQDCKITVFADSPDCTMTVCDNQLRVISTSTISEDFIQYHVLSTSFHLDDTQGLSFNIMFNSNNSTLLTIQRIVLSFSNNNQSLFLSSPGKLQIESDDLTTYLSVISVSNNSKTAYTMTGKLSQLMAKNKILVQDNVFNISAKVKNTGEKATKVFLGFAPYTKDGNKITARNNPYKNDNKVFKVVSSQKGINKIVIDSYPEWIQNSHLVLNAKEDLSDFPNFNFVNSRIISIKKLNENDSEITFEKPIPEIIAPGTPVRIHSPYGSSFLYVSIKTLEPGEEAVLTGTIKKDDDFLLYSSKALCRGTYYVQPILLSHSISPDEENSVLISDFWVSY